MPYLEGLPHPRRHVDQDGFWEGCREGELRIQRCAECGAYRHPPRPVCPECGSASARWARVSGKGRVWSWTIVREPVHPLVEGRVPFNVVQVELVERPGLRLVGNLVDAREAGIEIGTPVEVVFEAAGEGVVLPRFRQCR